VLENRLLNVELDDLVLEEELPDIEVEEVEGRIAKLLKAAGGIGMHCE
jgi:hypothetical protein